MLNALDPKERRDLGCPVFDETRHGGVCREVCFARLVALMNSCRLSVQLKFMYVGITRARKNVWIVDGSERAQPLLVSTYVAEPGASTHCLLLDVLEIARARQRV